MNLSSTIQASEHAPTNEPSSQTTWYRKPCWRSHRRQAPTWNQRWRSSKRHTDRWMSSHHTRRPGMKIIETPRADMESMMKLIQTGYRTLYAKSSFKTTWDHQCWTIVQAPRQALIVGSLSQTTWNQCSTLSMQGSLSCHVILPDAIENEAP